MGYWAIFIILTIMPAFYCKNGSPESLKWLWKIDGNRRISRWALLLQKCNFEVQYRSGPNQAHVDIFTRNIEDDESAEETIDKIRTHSYFPPSMHLKGKQPKPQSTKKQKLNDYSGKTVYTMIARDAYSTSASPQARKYTCQYTQQGKCQYIFRYIDIYIARKMLSP